MNVLIDYANIPQHIRQRGLVHIAERIVNIIPISILTNNSRVLLKLYGGWYSNTSQTHAAQDLTSEVLNEFPRIIETPISSKLRKVIVNCDMGYYLEFLPSKHILNTHRLRGIPTGLSCRKPDDLGCNDPGCPIKNIYEFISTGRCTNQCCDLMPRDLLYTSQQKLVDSMIITDLLFLIWVCNEKCISIVTSDEDFVPSILGCLHWGSTVFHIHTRNGRRTPNYYMNRVNNNYIQGDLGT